MSLYVLDTDILTLLQKAHPVVQQRVSSHARVEVATSVISVEEQLSGWYTSLRRARRRDVLAHAYQRLVESVEFFGKLSILSFPEQAILRYEQVDSPEAPGQKERLPHAEREDYTATLMRLKLQVRKNDLRIAAITLENTAILVTRNLRDFQGVPNLVVEDWSL